jgi:hypothetical protein
MKSILILVALCSTAAAEEVRGVLSRFDPARRELVLEGRGRRARGLALTFTLAPEAQVLLGRKPGELADLQPGVRVTVLYEARDGRNVVQAVTVHGALLREAMKAAPPADGNGIAGKLIRVALTEREIVVVGPGPRGDETEVTFAVPKPTVITRDRKPIQFEDLKEGDRVVVHGELRDGKRVAQSIQIGEGVAMSARDVRNERIERLRQLLRLADQLLEMAQEKR